jgi:uncharacterized protein
VNGSYIIDTGPIVGLLDADDKHHQWAREMFGSLEPPFTTCEAVLAEACFLVRKMQGGIGAIFSLLDRNVLAVPFRLEPNKAEVQALLTRYASVPMSLADACLVRMAELDSKGTVLTFDSDFKIYRRNGRHVVPVAMPD